jgi:serine/threonine-protein kinase
VAVFASREGLTEAETHAVQKFVSTMMRLDSVEVSIDQVTWSEATTQMMTGSTEFDLPTEEALPPPTTPDKRYLDLGRIGIGGMGEVRRVRDTVLNRFVAMKVLRSELSGKRAAVLRFIAEAQATAQLQHPGMVPVHDIGQLGDGRWFFTMKELQGDTLEEAMRLYRGGDGRGLRGMIGILAQVCDAVAFAHANGAIHRDLKPANVLVGAYGEVVVLDWGLVKATGTPTGAPGLVTDLQSIGTKLGTVIGTPAYMPPEQAKGQHDEVGPQTDVYALGAILYEVLSGRRPYLGGSTEVLDQILTSNPPPLPSTVPAGLAAICKRAMRRSASKRYADAGELSAALRGWTDGAARRERALELLDRADALQPEVENALARADHLAEEAEMVLGPIPTWAPTEAKREGWALEEESLQARIQADLTGLERLQLLRSALTELPEMPEAQERLAYVYHFCHQRAVQLGDVREMAQYEALLRAHDRGRYAAYLDGTGRLDLSTRPQGVRGTLHRMKTVDRRLVPVEEDRLPPTPLREVPLGHGSWLVCFEAEGRIPVRVPVRMDRGAHWTGVPPGGRASVPLVLPFASEVADDDCYVPAGWCRLGETPARDVWVDGFFLKRFPVTNAAYLAFLNDLVTRGENERALRYQPATTGGPCFGRDADGLFTLHNRATGVRWAPDTAVVFVSALSARAYAAWFAARTGEAWRLPWEDEWEKAARGVDGRRFVMGDFLDPSWAEIRGSSADETAADVTAFPLDESVYGVRGLTGGVADWCQDLDQGQLVVRGGRAERVRASPGDRGVVRGGMRTVPPSFCAASLRHVVPVDRRSVRVGFRLARSLEPEQDPETSGIWILGP